jgi:hypothetical protein
MRVSDSARYWPRRSQRICTDTEIGLRRRGSFGFQVPMSDLSVEGCKIEFVEAVSTDEYVVARLPNLEALAARVCWVKGSEAGLQFRKSLHPAVFEHLIAQLNRACEPIACAR